jgi:hypothetical protein
MFVGYSKDVKGYRLLQPHCKEIIIRRYVKFDENILAYDPNSTFFPSLACKPSLKFVPSFGPIIFSSSPNNDSEEENSSPPTHLPKDESIELEPEPTPLLLIWVC